MKYKSTHEYKPRRVRRHKPIGLRHRKKLGPKSVLRKNKHGI